jgi:putative flippase GtrA
MKVKLLATISSNLSYNTRNSLAKGAIVGIITAIIYLAVVVITTPNLPPSMAIGTAIKVNGIIIVLSL